MWLVAMETRTLYGLFLCSLLQRCLLCPPGTWGQAFAVSLQQQWDSARASATDTRHVKLEHMCTQCFGRTLSARPTYRFCEAPMKEALTIVPGQWPPIGATKGMISKYEPQLAATTAKDPVQPTAPDVPMHDGQIRCHAPQGTSPPASDCGATQTGDLPPRETHLGLASGWLWQSPRHPRGQPRCPTCRTSSPKTRRAGTRSGRGPAQAGCQSPAACRTELVEEAHEQTKQAEESAAQEVVKQRSAISEFETTHHAATHALGHRCEPLPHPPGCGHCHHTPKGGSFSPWHSPATHTSCARRTDEECSPQVEPTRPPQISLQPPVSPKKNKREGRSLTARRPLPPRGGAPNRGLNSPPPPGQPVDRRGALSERLPLCQPISSAPCHPASWALLRPTALASVRAARSDR